MARGQRVHRLPQRLDYTLIPAPLDLTLPLVDEKSPLPAIIVTPSSPRSTTDFSIAFLAPAPKPSFCQRVFSMFPSLPSSPLALPVTQKPPLLSLSAPSKARTIVIMVLLLMVMGCHVVTHRMAIQRPRMDFENPGLGPHEHSMAEFGNVQVPDEAPGPRFFEGWLDLWESDGKRPHSDFVVSEHSEGR